MRVPEYTDEDLEILDEGTARIGAETYPISAAVVNHFIREIIAWRRVLPKHKFNSETQEIVAKDE